MVGANCGTDNPMMQMVNHFTQDKARAAELGQLGGRPQPGMVRQHSPRFPSPHVSSASSIGCRSFHGCCCSGGMDAAYTLRRCYPAGSARPDAVRHGQNTLRPAQDLLKNTRMRLTTIEYPARTHTPPQSSERVATVAVEWTRSL